MFTKSIASLGAAAFAMFATASANFIDFTEDNTPPITAGTVDGVAFTVTAVPDSINNNETSVGGSCVAVFGGFLDCARDGFGIGDDEISTSNTGGFETLTVTFAEEVFITQVYILDLFRSFNNAEIGEFSVDGGLTFTTFGGLSAGLDFDFSGLSGTFVINVLAETSEIIFRAPTLVFANDSLGVNDFAIAGIAVGEIPVPGAAILLLSGLAGFGFAGRRKRA